MKTYLNQSAVVRRLGVAHVTFKARLNAGTIKPDACLIKDGNQAPALLFEAGNLPAIKKAMIAKPVEVVC